MFPQASAMDVKDIWLRVVMLWPRDIKGLFPSVWPGPKAAYRSLALSLPIPSCLEGAPRCLVLATLLSQSRCPHSALDNLREIPAPKGDPAPH